MLRAIGNGIANAASAVGSTAGSVASAVSSGVLAAASKIHDAAVGSSNLSLRTYPEFLDDARTIALLLPEVSGFNGRRLSIGLGFHPDFEEDDGLQGFTRALKRGVGAYHTTGLKVSEDINLWAEALNKAPEFRIQKKCEKNRFEFAVKGLLYQADLYTNDFVKLQENRKPEESLRERAVIIENFKNAAANVQLFINTKGDLEKNKKEIDEHIKKLAGQKQLDEIFSIE